VLNRFCSELACWHYLYPNICSASSEFYKDGKYDLDFKNPKSDPSKWLTGVELSETYIKM
jgi:hypothetical protein